MLEILNSVDIALFRFVNSSLSNPVLDIIMPFLTDLNKQLYILSFVAALLLWMLIRGDKRLRLTAILLIVAIIFSDQINSSVIKYFFERQRPCHILSNVHLLVSCGSGYSFPSSHAVNNFTGALIIAFFYPRSKWLVFVFAFLVAFSRVYVGVHYPSDVIGGAAIGIICGGFILIIFNIAGMLWYYFIKNRIGIKKS